MTKLSYHGQVLAQMDHMTSIPVGGRISLPDVGVEFDPGPGRVNTKFELVGL